MHESPNELNLVLDDARMRKLTDNPLIDKYKREKMSTSEVIERMIEHYYSLTSNDQMSKETKKWNNTVTAHESRLN